MVKHKVDVKKLKVNLVIVKQHCVSIVIFLVLVGMQLYCGCKSRCHCKLEWLGLFLLRFQCHVYAFAWRIIIAMMMIVFVILNVDSS